MKKLFFLIFLIVLAFNLFGFTVVLKNDKSLSGKYVNETQKTITIKVQKALYKIDRSIVDFYISNDEKIAVGKAKEKLDTQKEKYNKTSDFIDITARNYKELTMNWRKYSMATPEGLYLILLKNDNRFVGDLYFASADYLYLKHPSTNKIYKIEKDSVMKIKFEKNDVTEDILNRYDGEENLISDEEEIVTPSFDKSPYSYNSKRRRNIIKNTRLFLSYVIASHHELSHKDDHLSVSVSNGLQLSLERLIILKKDKVGYGLGMSFMPYRTIKVGRAKPTYGFWPVYGPVYGLLYVPFGGKFSYTDLAIRGGIDFLFSSPDYKGRFNSNPFFYFSASYFAKISKLLIGLGYQINFGKLTASGTTDFILIKDSSFFISLGFM